MSTIAAPLRRIGLTFISIFSFVITSSAQSDTTEYLFKKAQYSYMHYGIGYSPLWFHNQQIGHAFSANLAGVVFNDRIALGLDIVSWAPSSTNGNIYYGYRVNSFLATYLNIETLICPRKTFNVSFPMRIGYGTGQVLEGYGNNYYAVQHRCALLEPGGMIWINLLKQLSFGCGGSYRFAVGGFSNTDTILRGFTGCYTLRFKFYTKEYWAKAMERQKQYMEMQK